jgi:L-2-hydroxyglutarate oxidase
MHPHRYDVAIIGGGIVGLGVAMKLAPRLKGSLLVLEAESRLASHQSGRNSGVIHAGLYYKPGSLKAKNCAAGRESMYRFCGEQDIPCERCGKLVVATSDREVAALDELERRGQANGLGGIRRIDARGISDYEPHCRGMAALWVPDTGIVDFAHVARRYAELSESSGAEVRTDARLLSVDRRPDETVLETTSGVVHCRNLINCAGLQSDRVARLCGVDPGVRIVPFRGEFYELLPDRKHLVRNLIYPVPDPQFPFLGVHFTRTIHGQIEAGPNAVLALAREGYRWRDVSLRDALDVSSYGGFWRMAGRYWKTGLGEIYRSLNKRAFVQGLQKLVPEIAARDIRPARTGVRAQALERSGALVDDFRIERSELMLHVLNAPSPAATASLSVAQHIVELADETFELPGRSSDSAASS